MFAAACGAGGAEGPPSFAEAPTTALSSLAGHFHVLERTSPSPVVRGLNAFEVEVRDADGAPVVGALLSATPWMPAHGHGTSVVPSIVDEGGGVYEIDEVLFYMPGRWELRTEIAQAGASDLVVATFDVR